MIRRLVIKAAIIFFFLWHVVAVGVYSIPYQASGTIVDTLRDAIRPVVEPYLLLTSQWQMWDLFSPEPLRRVTRRLIQARIGNDWQTLRVVQPAATSFWMMDDFSWLLEMEEDNIVMPELRTRMLQAMCKPLGLREGTFVAMVTEYQILPEHPLGGTWDRYWERTDGWWSTLSTDIVPCPAPTDPAILPIYRL